MSGGAAGSGVVGVGIIGAGVISEQYLTNLTTFPDVAVRFIADLDLDRASAAAAKFGVAASGTVAELLARDDIEIVVNLTIPKVHVEVALQALAAGKHVWSEKPFALDRASGQSLLDEAHRLGLRVATAPDTFLGAGLQTGLAAIRSGEIGSPLAAFASMQGPGPEGWHPNPEFLFQVGAGPLFDMGPYYLTALVQALGPVRRVTALAAQSRATRTIGSGPRAGTDFAVEVPTHVQGLIEFEGGGSAQVTFSFDSSLVRYGVVEIVGSGGTIVLPDPNMFDGDSSIWPTGAADATAVEAVGPSQGRGLGILDLARSIRAGVPERASGELAYHVLDIMVSIAESAEIGSTVDVVSTTAIPDPIPAGWDPLESTL
jgi:predicted dehydrogenase